MALGSYDANGIWNFGESDNIAPFSTTLNKLATSTSSAFTADRARISTLEQNTLSGLTPITPTSVTVSGGTAAVSGLGAVTHTGTTSVSLNGIFKSDFTNYRILWRQTAASANGNAWVRARAAGSDETSTNYNRAGYYINVLGGGAFSQAVSNNGICGSTTATTDPFGFVTFDISGPYINKRTVWVSDNMANDSGQWQAFKQSCVLNTSTVYDGMTFSQTAGTLSGVITVYGYNQ